MARGEADIIQRFLAPLAAGHAGAYGLLDDAALISPPPGVELVVTTDAVAEGVHFFPEDQPADIAWKAVAVNVSDLVAKGAAPHAYVMSLAFPGEPEDAWLAAFARGLDEAQRAFGISLVGGDTDRRPGPLCVTITAIGFVPAGGIVRRGGATAGDHIFVSGTLGDSALGLELRAGTVHRAMLEGLPEIHRAAFSVRYLRPRPPLALVPALRAHASAAMDISDGLVKDLGRLVGASGTGALADIAALPLSAAAAEAAARKSELRGLVATGGDDYEVLATVAPAHVAGFMQLAARAGVTVTEIGRITDGAGVTVRGLDGRPMAFPAPGYDHF